MSSPVGLDFYDLELRAHHEHLRAAYGIGRGDEILDIGCGTGLTAREAARASAPGRVVGVDISERMLERARELTAGERLENVSYELGDAQVSRFDPERFDVVRSEEHTSELQSHVNLVCRLLLEKKKKNKKKHEHREKLTN